MATELLGKSKQELREFCAAMGEPEFAGGAARTAGEGSADNAAGSEAEVCFGGRVGAVFVGIGGLSDFGGSGVYAERGTADDLHFDAGRLRRGLPVLFDGATGIDSEPGSGRDSFAGAAAA